MLPIERHLSPVHNSLMIGFWGFVLTSVKYPDSSHLSTVFQSVAKICAGELALRLIYERAVLEGAEREAGKAKRAKVAKNP